MPKLLILTLIAFLVPVGVVAGLNWKQSKSYLAGDPSDTAGTLYCFQASG